MIEHAKRKDQGKKRRGVGETHRQGSQGAGDISEENMDGSAGCSGQGDETQPNGHTTRWRFCDRGCARLGQTDDVLFLGKEIQTGLGPYEASRNRRIYSLRM
ncbi:hypothetical protein BU26DRAFT_348760 [Trematosphaeria pertusa]|uniref:Uncharacterized protein n=1 Tax=Trematosphaeria pertusa TaxID=390896 RepID=A0A6A6IBB1_9PLEO|nr:uncharacterized protein BU26DRAFT_348760 [Trematosphaeria pertusa]KAF2247497.1 hypothetical protein BU26DRAFT_348760 [Trematosphaeria pertusa]